MAYFPSQATGSSSASQPNYAALLSDQPTASDLSEFDLASYFLWDEGPNPASTGQPQSLVSPMVDSGQHNIASNLANSTWSTRGRSASELPTSCTGGRRTRMQGPRTGEGSSVAFRTKSEVDVLDDGFKWRKYGKKSVKSSPSPRNYYYCSTDSCPVKKRVERDIEDPSYVITTYIGVHNHMTPGVVYETAQDTTSGLFYVAGWNMPPSS